MSTTLDMLRPGDKAALVVLSTPELSGPAQSALAGMGYKVHVAENHDDCLKRFAQVQYQVVILEDGFAGSPPGENTSLRLIQSMAMPMRRHSTLVLLGPGYKSLDPMQAFVQSVHAVVNTADIENLPAVLLRVVTDTDTFLTTYRESQARQAQGK